MLAVRTMCWILVVGATRIQHNNEMHPSGVVGCGDGVPDELRGTIAPNGRLGRVYYHRGAVGHYLG
jgi:hypothetical protein